MRYLCIIFLSFTLSASAIAGRWYRVDWANSEIISFMDRDSIQGKYPHKKIWSQLVFQGEKVTEDNIIYDNIKGLDEYDCKNRLSRALVLLAFNGLDLVKSYNSKLTWEPVPPNSLNEIRMKGACEGIFLGTPKQSIDPKKEIEHLQKSKFLQNTKWYGGFQALHRHLGPMTIFFIDPIHHKIDRNFRKIWIWQILPKALDSQSRDYDNLKLQCIIDCKNKLVHKKLYEIYYDGNQLVEQGEVIDSNSEPPMPDFAANAICSINSIDTLQWVDVAVEQKKLQELLNKSAKESENS